MYRVIDKETNIFLRDDFTYNEETEIGLDVEPSQGLYQPKWTGTEWVESIDVIPTPPPTEPTLEERVEAMEMMEIERLLS